MAHQASLYSVFLNTFSLRLCQPRIIIIIVLAAAGPISASLNASGNLQCIDSADWVSAAFQAYDCYSAISLFEDYEVYRHSTTVFEFIASAITPLYPQFAVTTPRKYTYESCTMTIAMIADVPPGTSVPGLPAGKQWAKTDLGDYVEIEKAVLRVRDGCLSVVGGGEGAGADGGRSGREKEGEGGGRRSVGFVNPTGYETAGMNGAIGVFLWDTNSAMNRLVKEKIGIGVGNLPGVVAS